VTTAKPSLFDANSHPTVKGGWPVKGLDSTFERLATELESSNYRGACAVGVWGLEDYSHKAFIDQCRRYANLVPIAGYFPSRSSEVERDLAAIKKMGFRGIKIHPREPPIRFKDARLAEVFRAASRLHLRIFLCTYAHTSLEHYPVSDPLYEIAALLRSAPAASVLLVHGGGVDLLRYAELVRFNPNLLLDLSLTFMKYRSSSLDQDIRFLFERFDQRICLGTDFPEYSPQEVSEQFIKMSRGIPKKKLENIAFRNIEQFLA